MNPLIIRQIMHGLKNSAVFVVLIGNSFNNRVKRHYKCLFTLHLSHQSDTILKQIHTHQGAAYYSLFLCYV